MKSARSPCSDVRGSAVDQTVPSGDRPQAAYRGMPQPEIPCGPATYQLKGRGFRNVTQRHLTTREHRIEQHQPADGASV